MMARRICLHVRGQWMGALALFLVLAGGGAIAAFNPIGDDGDIDACFAKRSGDLDLLKGKKCGKREKPVSWGVVGPQGEVGPLGPQGATGPQGAQGVPGPTLGTFADSGGVAIVLGGTDKTVTSTAAQIPGANGAVGGPIDLPANGRYSQIAAVRVKTSGAGAFDCGLQVSADGGAFFELDRASGTAPQTLRFTVPVGGFTTPTRQEQYRVVCKGAGTVEDTDFSTIAAFRAP